MKTSDIELLVAAREAIRNGWLKYIYGAYDYKKNRYCFCAAGALRDVTCNEPKTTKQRLFRHLAGSNKSALAKIAPLPGRRSKYHRAFDAIVNYNDRKSTTKADVLKLYNNAIKKAK